MWVKGLKNGRRVNWYKHLEGILVLYAVKFKVSEAYNLEFFGETTLETPKQMEILKGSFWQCL